METSVQIRVLCACGQETIRESSYQPNGSLTESIEVYRCPSDHTTQVLFFLVPQPSLQRRKPDTAPPFPGGSRSW